MNVPYGKIIKVSVECENRIDEILPLFHDGKDIVFIYELSTNYPKITSSNDFYFVNTILNNEWTGEMKDINDIEEWKQSSVIKLIFKRG